MKKIFLITLTFVFAAFLNAQIFIDVNAGLTGISNSYIAWGDFDNDSDLDILMCGQTTSGTPVTKIYNNDNGSFTDINAGLAGVTKGAAVWGDYDIDGDLDILITGENSDNKTFLYRNDNGNFTEVSNNFEYFGDYSFAAWGDYDNDGDLDIFIGGTYEAGGTWPRVIYINNNDGTFTRLNNTVLTDSSTYTRGGSWGDYDNDGDIDLITARDGKNRLYTNELDNENHFINIRLTGVTANKSAIGSIIKVKATINSEPVWQMREISGQTGHAAQNSLRAHFGLGDASVIDSIEIDWAGSDAVEYYTNVPADQFMHITEGEASAIGDDYSPDLRSFELNQNYPNPFNPEIHFTLAESTDSQSRVEILDLRGRLVSTLSVNRQKQLTWVPENTLTAGVYFACLRTVGKPAGRLVKITFLK